MTVFFISYKRGKQVPLEVQSHSLERYESSAAKQEVSTNGIGKHLGIINNPLEESSWREIHYKVCISSWCLSHLITTARRVLSAGASFDTSPNALAFEARATVPIIIAKISELT